LTVRIRPPPNQVPVPAAVLAGGSVGGPAGAAATKAAAKAAGKRAAGTMDVDGEQPKVGACGGGGGGCVVVWLPRLI
jgi:hypothetical protein